jgi:hypothetical protein
MGGTNIRRGMRIGTLRGTRIGTRKDTGGTGTRRGMGMARTHRGTRTGNTDGGRESPRHCRSCGESQPPPGSALLPAKRPASLLTAASASTGSGGA